MDPALCVQGSQLHSSHPDACLEYLNMCVLQLRSVRKLSSCPVKWSEDTSEPSEERVCVGAIGDITMGAHWSVVMAYVSLRDSAQAPALLWHDHC